MSDLSRARVEAFLEMLSAERGAAQNTLTSYERDLDDLADFLSGRKVTLGAATREDLAAYLSDLARRGFQPTSQARRLSAMRQFYKFLYAEGLRGDDPTAILDAPKKTRSLPKGLTVEDVTGLLSLAEQEANLEGPDRPARIRRLALIELLYATGMRVSELVSLATDRRNFFDPNIGIYVCGNTPGCNYAQGGDAWERPVHVEFFETNGLRAFAQHHLAQARFSGNEARHERLSAGLEATRRDWQLLAELGRDLRNARDTGWAAAAARAASSGVPISR